MSMYDNKIDKGLPPDDPLGWLIWLPPPGYEVDKLRDFTQTIPEDGSCALCGKEESECPCYRYP